MFCSKCGHLIEDDSKFCSNCGEKIKIEEAKPIEEKEGKDSTFIVIMFLLISFLILAFAFSIAYTGNKEDDKIFDLITQKRDATTEDIFVKVENKTLYIQASDKIEDLVLKVRYLDKSGKTLKTEDIKVGNITPGNEFSYKLTESGIAFADIGKVHSYKIAVEEGKVKK